MRTGGMLQAWLGLSMIDHSSIGFANSLSTVLGGFACYTRPCSLFDGQTIREEQNVFQCRVHTVFVHLLIKKSPSLVPNLALASFISVNRMIKTNMIISIIFDTAPLLFVGNRASPWFGSNRRLAKQPHEVCSCRIPWTYLERDNELQWKACFWPYFRNLINIYIGTQYIPVLTPTPAS